MRRSRSAGWRLLALLTPTVIAACTVTRQGTLEELAGAAVLPVTVAVESDSAFVRAVDPRTGEVLQGRLSLDPGGRHSRPGVHPEPPLPSGSAGMGAAGAGVPLRGGTVMNLTGELLGDQGTALRCTLHVEQRIRLRGAGTCHDSRKGITNGFRLRF